MTALLLTADELKSLTGTKQAKRQCAWLTERNWVFEAPARRSEGPKVDRAYYLSRMSGATPVEGGRAKPRLGNFGKR